MVVTIIGVGLIGGSIAKDLRKVKFATHIVGVDANPAYAKQAIELGLVDEVLKLKAAVQKADLVVLAVPVDAMMSVLPTVLDHVSPTTSVTDTGSTKLLICEALKNHPNRQNFVPSHPMSGTENSGPSAAKEDLFKNKIAIICDQEDSKPIHVMMVEKMYHSIGMNIAYMSSDEQDHTTAHVSHLPHITAFALANAVLDQNERSIIFDLASGGFQSTVRLAKSSYKMWGPIFTQNKKYVMESLNIYIDHLEQFRTALAKEDSADMYTLIENANKIRPVLDGSCTSMEKKEESNIKLYRK